MYSTTTDTPHYSPSTRGTTHGALKVVLGGSFSKFIYTH